MFAPARSGGTPDSLTGRTPSALPQWLLNPGSWGAAANRLTGLWATLSLPRAAGGSIRMPSRDPLIRMVLYRARRRSDDPAAALTGPRTTAQTFVMVIGP